jgi:hypothetical protein
LGGADARPADVLVKDVACLYISADNQFVEVFLDRLPNSLPENSETWMEMDLGHTGSTIQLPHCLFADADSVEFDDGFSGNVSCLQVNIFVYLQCEIRISSDGLGFSNFY